jgi:ubiquinone/menaquinone biosynthesis C-methylase UbiE/ribosomal protein S27E
MAKTKEQIIEELGQVKFVGPHLAEELYTRLKVRTLEDLVTAGEQGRLADLAGVGPKKQESILRSAHRQLNQRNGRATAPTNGARRGSARHAESAAHRPASAKRPTPAAKPVDKPAAKPVDKPSEPVSAKPESSAAKAVVEPAEAPRTLRERFIDTLRCPACGNDDFEIGSSTITCTACQRQFNLQDGVADLAPPHVPDRSMTQRLMEARFYAQFYEDVMRPRLTGVVSDRTLREEYRLSADYLDLGPDTRLLDVACGTANFTRYFAQRLGLAGVTGPDVSQPLVVGMDISWPMLETARNYLRREGLEEEIFLVRGDATRIPVKRGAYNRIHCSGSLHMMVDIDEALRNFARVLEPGGVCVIGTFILGEGLLRRFVKRLAEVPTRFHWFSREELHRRLERAGFEIVEESVAGDAITLKTRRV